MSTVKDLVAQLSALEDQDQPVFALWWIAEDFEALDEIPSPEQFKEILQSTSVDYTNVSEQLYDAVYMFMHKFMQEGN